jgi:hypothetical protein
LRRCLHHSWQGYQHLRRRNLRHLVKIVSPGEGSTALANSTSSHSSHSRHNSSGNNCTPATGGPLLLITLAPPPAAAA